MFGKFTRVVIGVGVLGLLTAPGSLAKGNVAGFVTNVQAVLPNGKLVRMMGVGTVLSGGKVSGMTSLNFSDWSFSGNHTRFVFKDKKSVVVYATGVTLPTRQSMAAEITLSSDTGYPISFKLLSGNRVAASSGMNAEGNLIPLPVKAGATQIVAPK